MPPEIKAKIIASEFIYEKASFPQCHASTIIETGDGLLTSWFGGTYESYPDNCIYISSRKDGKWIKPVQVADGIMDDGIQYPCWNPVLFRKKNGDVILYYKVGPTVEEWWGMYKISTDDGKTWSRDVKIPGSFLGPIRTKPKVLLDGTILYPTSYETSKEWNIYVETSDQNFNDWRRIDIDNNLFNAIQPTILFYSDGRIQMLCRSRERRIVETWSADQGKKWSPVKVTKIPNNNSGIDAVTLDDDLQLLVCNPIETGRYKLAVLYSFDGKNWFEMIVLEDHPAVGFSYSAVIAGEKTKSEFSYPAIIKGNDGKIHITYTYNREKIKYVCLEIHEK